MHMDPKRALGMPGGSSTRPEVRSQKSEVKRRECVGGVC
jgi:hypothetical protein